MRITKIIRPSENSSVNLLIIAKNLFEPFSKH